MKIVLVGYMGSGKSAVGKRLASILNMPFIDMDSEIEKEAGCGISGIFSKKGELYFRKTERMVLGKLLAKPQNFVLATGGGTPCYSNAMAYMLAQENVVVVYLRMSIGVLVARLFREKENRPLLKHLNSKEIMEDFVRKHLFERSHFYNQANLVVDNEAGIEETVEKILLKLF